jgi:hypothetical protein
MALRRDDFRRRAETWKETMTRSETARGNEGVRRYSGAISQLTLALAFTSRCPGITGVEAAASAMS